MRSLSRTSDTNLHVFSSHPTLLLRFCFRKRALRFFRALLLRLIAPLLCDGTNLREGGEVKGKLDSEVGSQLRATLTQKAAARRELNHLPLMSAVREYTLVSSAHSWKLPSTHMPSHCNRALHPPATCMTLWLISISCDNQGPDFDDLKISEKLSIKWPKNI
jgi:hypothetical protein